MSQLLNAQHGCLPEATDCVDVAEAMTYNEWAQLLETTNPDTGELYTPDQFNVINYNDLGTAMLQDAIFARASWLAEGSNEDTAVKFLKATFKGWMYCRDNADACARLVVEAGTALGLGHQTWQMNEVNALIWPARTGLASSIPTPGITRSPRLRRAESCSTTPRADAYRVDLAQRPSTRSAASRRPRRHWTKAVVEITPGGV